MATIRKQIRIQAAPEDVWAAVRDFHQVHERLCPGVLRLAQLLRERVAQCPAELRNATAQDPALRARRSRRAT